MEGFDKQWLQNSGLQTVRYSLPPGEYVFKIYASHVFNKDAEPMKEIHILIHPPFWKTWWFIIGLAIFLLAILTVSINRYNKRQFQKKLLLVEGEHKLRMERERISRDLHDSLGAYANAVLYNTELLQDEENKNERDELIKDLRFASKDIITALRETIWALKKDTYTAEECLLRIRNFIQPFASYYKHINFKVEGEAPAAKIFHHSKAFNLVRIVQEAVSNAIKHAKAKSIFIHSSFENDQWKIIIRDDGKGFDYTVTKDAQSGNGLSNMEHRAKDAGLIYTIESGKTIGTTITIIDSTG
jgi:signal transduction histidine kinase